MSATLTQADIRRAQAMVPVFMELDESLLNLISHIDTSRRGPSRPVDPNGPVIVKQGEPVAPPIKEPNVRQSVDELPADLQSFILEKRANSILLADQRRIERQQQQGTRTTKRRLRKEPS